MIFPIATLSIDVEERVSKFTQFNSSGRRKSAKNRRYSLFCPRPEVVSRVGESTSRHSGGLFPAFTRGRATKSLTMMFIAVMRNGPQSTVRPVGPEIKNSSKHGSRAFVGMQELAKRTGPVKKIPSIPLSRYSIANNMDQK